MALSENEQRLLDQLEAALAADDPTFASRLRGSGPRPPAPRVHAPLAGIGFVAGLVALVAGMEVGWVLSIVGFLVMLVSTVVGLGAWQPRTGGPQVRTPRSAQHRAFTDDRRRRDDSL